MNVRILTRFLLSPKLFRPARRGTGEKLQPAHKSWKWARAIAGVCESLLLLAAVRLALAVAPLGAQTGSEPSGAKARIYLPHIIAATPSIEQQVVALVNQERARAGCSPLAIAPQLSAAAQMHSQDMALGDFFSHTGSDGSTPWQRMAEAGYSFSRAAENVAAGQPTPASVMVAWMSSKQHSANVLNCQMRHIGIGYFYLPDDAGKVNYGHYWTQDFGSP